MSIVSVKLDIVSVTFRILSIDLHEESILSISIDQNKHCIRHILDSIHQSLHIKIIKSVTSTLGVAFFVAFNREEYICNREVVLCN